MRNLPYTIHSHHQVLTLTGHGRTFVCGDLHGCYDELIHELSLVAFDRGTDSLVVLGDITDRGIKNHECVKLLSEPWFNSTLGNHDEMMMNAINPRSDKSFWRANGGGWFDLLTFTEQEEVQFVCERYVGRLPLSMTLILPDDTHVGLIHADAPSDWRKAMEGTQARTEALWGRQRIRHGNTRPVENVDMVLVGHTSNNTMIRLGNVVYIDTGAGFKNGRLTLLEIGNSREELEANISLRQKADRMTQHPGILFEPRGTYSTGDNM
ncbi:metallophosphoesterase [Kordiimonas sp.]|uniref:metallophosphoesterase n=1 Tax=Kordiimonas sp. TaxID=1970157 RepID=UPI003A92C94E